jgi:hypothetical protein
MQTIHGANTKGLALAAVLAFGVCVPMTAHAREHARDAGLVVAAMAQDEAPGADAVEEIRAERLAQFRAIELALSSSLGSPEATRAERLAQFRAIELILSRSLGAGHQETPSCDLAIITGAASQRLVVTEGDVLRGDH